MARRYVRMVVEMIADQPVEAGREGWTKGEITAFLNDHPSLQAGEVKVDFYWLGPVEVMPNGYAKPWVEKLS